MHMLHLCVSNYNQNPNQSPEEHASILSKEALCSVQQSISDSDFDFLVYHPQKRKKLIKTKTCHLHLIRAQFSHLRLMGALPFAEIR